MTFPVSNVVQNLERGPDTRTKSFWAGSVGSALTAADLVFCGQPPRRLYVGHAGDLTLTHTDGNGSTYDDLVTGIVAGTVFFKSSIVGVKTANSTAYNLTFGW
jgi:hypothetical protein